MIILVSIFLIFAFSMFSGFLLLFSFYESPESIVFDRFIESKQNFENQILLIDDWFFTHNNEEFTCYEIDWYTWKTNCTYLYLNQWKNYNTINTKINNDSKIEFFSDQDNLSWISLDMIEKTSFEKYSFFKTGENFQLNINNTWNYKINIENKNNYPLWLFASWFDELHSFQVNTWIWIFQINPSYNYNIIYDNYFLNEEIRENKEMYIPADKPNNFTWTSECNNWSWQINLTWSGNTNFNEYFSGEVFFVLSGTDTNYQTWNLLNWCNNFDCEWTSSNYSTGSYNFELNSERCIWWDCDNILKTPFKESSNISVCEG